LFDNDDDAVCLVIHELVRLQMSYWNGSHVSYP